MAKYIWQDSTWPHFRWRSAEIEAALVEGAFHQGRFLGELSALGFDLRNQAGFEAISEEIINSAAIEGELLNQADVRSSVARRMEIALADPSRENHVVDARVEMILDATRGWNQAMTEVRLKSWHAALFPTGYSGLSRIAVATYRDDADGPMQVVSRHGSLMRTHFQAPPASRVSAEVRDFIAWLNVGEPCPTIVKAALAHLWFLTIHPFDDGNGRLARALTDWVLARGEQNELRFYSLSAEIQREKDDYYTEIEHAQRNSLDVTRWIVWFAACHRRAIGAAEATLAKILAKARFWREHQALEVNANQKRMLNALLDGFEGNLTSSKWAKICKVSQDTAGREIDALVRQGTLVRQGQGRATHYLIGGV